MTPEQAIGQLDRQLAKHGQPIAFRRGATEQNSVGFVTQKDREVILSPSSLGAFVPKANDDFVAGDALGKVTAAEPIQIGTTIVRWNLRVRLS